MLILLEVLLVLLWAETSAVADQSGSTYTRPRWLSWVGYRIWSKALLSILIRIFSLTHKTLIKILILILSPKTLKDSEETGSKRSVIFIHSWSWCSLFVYIPRKVSVRQSTLAYGQDKFTQSWGKSYPKADSTGVRLAWVLTYFDLLWRFL